MLPRKRRNSTTGGNKQCDTTTPVRHSSLSPGGFLQVGWSVYLIYSKSRKRTYVGSTTDVFRRLRQHRGEIRGGARSTSVSSDWELVSYVTGFMGRSPACRWERIVKCRSRGLDARDLAMVFIGIMRVCPTKGKKKQKEYEVPLGLHYIDAQQGQQP